MGFKICVCCGTSKPRMDFTPRKTSRDGLGSYCRPCNNAKIKARRDVDRVAYREKAASDARRRYAVNPDRVKSNSAAWRAAHPEAAKAVSRVSKSRIRAADPESARQKAREWSAANREKVRVWEAKRRAAEVSAATNWDQELDTLAISEAYDLRRLRCAATGIDWHVDHVVPLKAKHVCGLHNAYNLDVVPASYNCSKRNRFDESMLYRREWL